LSVTVYLGKPAKRLIIVCYLLFAGSREDAGGTPPHTSLLAVQVRFTGQKQWG